MGEGARWRGRSAAVSVVMVVAASCGGGDDAANSEPSSVEARSVSVPSTGAPGPIRDDPPVDATVTSNSTVITTTAPSTTRPTTTLEAPSTTPSTEAQNRFGCVDATSTTVVVTTSTTLPSVCDLINSHPADEALEEGEAWESVWDGTIVGSVQPVGCTPVSQTGSIILVVASDGEVFGVGNTDAGAYSCDNGADIPASSYGYGVGGELTDHFVLTFTDGVQVESGPVTGGHAELTQDTGFGVVTITLECRDCEQADSTDDED
jgi:hypothetical protein